MVSMPTSGSNKIHKERSIKPIIDHVASALAALRKKGAAGPGYPAFVGAIAFALTVSMSVPFGGVLAAAVLLAPARWRTTVLAASLGSSFGALVIYLVFHHLGWNQFIAVYPDIVASKAWIDATRWLSSYGMFALFAIAALPVPQTPALIFTAIYRLPVGEVWLAIFAGKLVKYGVYALGVKAFPDRFAGRYEALLPRMRRAP